jgi:hypothetical protein
LRSRTAQLLVALLLIGAVATTAAFVQRVNGGFILRAGKWHSDPIGEARLALNRLTRDCSAVQPISSEKARQAIELSDIEESARLSVPTPRAATTEQGWVLVETDLQNLEPAIFLLKDAATGYKKVASYSGTAAPFNDTQAIQAYLQREAPNAPPQLIKCYEPVGPPFAGVR